MVSMQRSHRTGWAIWPTMRFMISRPSWMTWPSRLEIQAVRGSWVETERARTARCPTAGAMCSVWKAPATLSGTRRAFAGGWAAKASSCSIVPAATTWPGPLLLAGIRPWAVDRGEDLVAVAAEHGGHAGRRRRRRLRHGLAALADQHHRLLGGDGARTGGRRELTDAVAGDRADLAERVGGMGEQLERGDEPGRDEERLGDLGLADRVGVRLGAEVGEIEPGDGREPLEAGGEGRVLEPGGEEAGGLGSLTGSDDDEHGSSLAAPGVWMRLGRARTHPTLFVGFLQRNWVRARRAGDAPGAPARAPAAASDPPAGGSRRDR